MYYEKKGKFMHHSVSELHLLTLRIHFLKQVNHTAFHTKHTTLSRTIKSIVIGNAAKTRYICLFECISKNAFVNIHIKIKTVQTIGGDVQRKTEVQRIDNRNIKGEKRVKRDGEKEAIVV